MSAETYEKFWDWWNDQCTIIDESAEKLTVVIKRERQRQHDIQVRRNALIDRLLDEQESLMSDPTRPQKDPKEGKTPILPLVIADLQERSDTGAKKYGSVLKSDNGRDALIDAYQEAMDLVMYLRQLIEEKDAKWDEPLRPQMTPGEIRGAELRDFIPMDSIFPTRYLSPAPVHIAQVLDKRETVLEEAQRLVHGDRGDSYGHPIFDLTRTADIATATLREKLRPGARLEAEDIAKFQIGTKLSRETHKPKRDNRVDGPGYFEVLDMIVQWRADHPGEDPRNHYDMEHPQKEGS